jgi:monoamine oxidase
MEGSTGKERAAIDPAKSKGPAVLVASYTRGQEARRLGNMTASQREEHTIRLVFSATKSKAGRGTIIAGRAAPLRSTRPASSRLCIVMSSRPRDGFILPGEHCSRSHSWMQGALESAEQAVDTIIARAG